MRKAMQQKKTRGFTKYIIFVTVAPVLFALCVLKLK